jgi:hypothetical protein
MGKLVRQPVRLLALAGLISVLACFTAPAVRAEGHQADSDDYRCNHGAPDDPSTIEACNRLRGTSQGAGVDVGHQANSDDYNCNHGDPNAPATLAACQRLRGTTEGVGRDEGHQRNSDDWTCHHGAPGDPMTAEACRRLRGGSDLAGPPGQLVVLHVVGDYAAPRHVAGHWARSVRYAVEFNCATGRRRRIGYARYAGHGATGPRLDAGRSVGPWRPVPPEAMPATCR